MSVSLNRLAQVFQSNDINGDGRLERSEIAKASLNSFGQGDTETGSLLATMVQGGVNGTGLLPSTDGSTVTFQNLQQLAAADGDGSSVSAQDFQTSFGSQASAGGQGININGLAQLASQATQFFSFAGQTITQGAGNAINSLLSPEQQQAQSFNSLGSLNSDTALNNPNNPIGLTQSSASSSILSVLLALFAGSK